MKHFYFDSLENVFGIKDEEKYRILKFNVYKCTIIGNRATVYSQDGLETFILNEDGSYKIEVN